MNMADKYGMPPLHIAALKGNGRLIILLLRNKADVNAKTKGGTTPLNLVEKGQDELADYLKKNGAREGTALREDVPLTF